MFTNACPPTTSAPLDMIRRQSPRWLRRSIPPLSDIAHPRVVTVEKHLIRGHSNRSSEWPISHGNHRAVGRVFGPAGYCLSNTRTLLTLWPCAFVPVCVAVIVLPSAETVTFVVTAGLPSTFPVTSNVRSSIRLRAFVVFGA